MGHVVRQFNPLTVQSFFEETKKVKLAGWFWTVKKVLRANFYNAFLFSCAVYGLVLFWRRNRLPTGIFLHINLYANLTYLSNRSVYLFWQPFLKYLENPFNVFSPVHTNARLRVFHSQSCLNMYIC